MVGKNIIGFQKGNTILQKWRIRLANLAVPSVAIVAKTFSAVQRALPGGVDRATASAFKDGARRGTITALLKTVGCIRGTADTLCVLHVSICAFAGAAREYFIGAATACICSHKVESGG
jgi:hypothetical protein